MEEPGLGPEFTPSEEDTAEVERIRDILFNTEENPNHGLNNIIFKFPGSGRREHFDTGEVYDFDYEPRESLGGRSDADLYGAIDSLMVEHGISVEEVVEARKNSKQDDYHGRHQREFQKRVFPIFEDLVLRHGYAPHSLTG